MKKEREEERRLPIPLSSAHATALSAHLKTLETYCREVERALKMPEGIYYRYTGRFPEASRQKIAEILAEIFERLRVIQGDLAVEKQEIDFLGYINAYLSEAWVTGSETKSDSLKAYGALPDGLADYLDPRMDEIERLLKHLFSIVEDLKARNPAP